MTTSPTPGTAARPGADRLGFLLGVASFTMWGMLSLYFPLLQPAGALEIVANRIVWSLLFCLGLLAATRQFGAYLTVLRSRRLMVILTTAATLIAFNWITYVYAVTSDKVIDASLGYFINPLVTVLLAVVVLKERLRTVQWVALGIGTVAVVVIAVGLGTVPWVALGLALTFGFYGLTKNRVGREVGAIPGLAVETTVLFPFALGYLVWLATQGSNSLAQHGVGHLLLLVSTGVATAMPLLCFSAAARRLSLSTIGLLQYIGPILQFVFGIVVFHETMPTVRWIGFGLVWLALVLLSVDALGAARVTRLARRQT